MILGKLIERLSSEDPMKILKLGFSDPRCHQLDSYRGYYTDLAFMPTPSVTVEHMLECAKSSLGRTFTGLDGGEYTMSKYTNVWLAEIGDAGEELGMRLLNFMLADEI